MNECFTLRRVESRHRCWRRELPGHSSLGQLSSCAAFLTRLTRPRPLSICLFSPSPVSLFFFLFLSRFPSFFKKKKKKRKKLLLYVIL